MAKSELTSLLSKRECLLKFAQTIFNNLLADFRRWEVPVSGKIDQTLGFVTMGSCYAVTYKEDSAFKINVSSLLFDAYGDRPSEALRSILAHELCHTINGCFNHGKTWKRWVMMLNEQHGFKINPKPFSKEPTDLF